MIWDSRYYAWIIEPYIVAVLSLLPATARSSAYGDTDDTALLLLKLQGALRQSRHYELMNADASAQVRLFYSGVLQLQDLFHTRSHKALETF